MVLADLGAESETDRRSVVSRMMAALMIKHASVLPARKAIQAIHAHFVDWNEVRISDDREIVAVLTGVGIESPKVLRDQIVSVLHDIYQQHNITNFEWNRLDEATHSKPVVAEGQEPPADSPTIRDEGLPKHAVHTGFLDGKRLLTETTQLELKLVQAKNSDSVYGVIYDNPHHPTANVVWAVALRFGLLKDGMDPTQALPELREIMGKDAGVFARAAITFYERNSRSLDKYFRQQLPMPVDEAPEVPFSVQIGFMNPEDVRRNEPLMPRSAGIGRLSKRATPKFQAKPAAVAAAASGPAKSSRSSASGRLKAVSDTASSKSRRSKAVSDGDDGKAE
jgi:hypothetical protein